MSWFLKTYQAVDKKQIFEQEDFLLFQTDRINIYLRDNTHFLTGNTTYLNVWTYTDRNSIWTFGRIGVLLSQRNGFYIMKFSKRYYLDDFFFKCFRNNKLTAYEYGHLAFEDGHVRNASLHTEFAAAFLHVVGGSNRSHYTEWNEGWDRAFFDKMRVCKYEVSQALIDSYKGEPVRN